MANMGIQWAFNAVFKRKFRYVFSIPGVVDDGIGALPPQSAARPSIRFEEISLPHLTETIYCPSRPSYEPMQMSLYDVKASSPVWDWILQLYNPSQGGYQTSDIIGGLDYIRYKKTCVLQMLDGCGNPIEAWTYENAWCTNANFGNLSNEDYNVCNVDISVRYDRAYRIF
jgi:hypothetical protein